MTRPSDQFDYMDLDDIEELLAVLDLPALGLGVPLAEIDRDVLTA